VEKVESTWDCNLQSLNNNKIACIISYISAGDCMKLADKVCKEWDEHYSQLVRDEYEKIMKKNGRCVMAD